MTTTMTNPSSRTMSERELNAKLTEIFNKIGQLDIAQQGIQELHELLMEYPECDVKVDAYLASAGTFFQKYIRKALSDITKREMKNHGMMSKNLSPLPTQKVNTLPLNPVDMNSTTTPVTTSSQKSLTTQKSNKPPHKFITNRCSNSMRPTTPTTSSVTTKEETKAPLETAKSSTSTPTASNKPVLSELSPTTKALMDKISKETFEQTRFRLHHIFQYEKYKTGQRRSSLPSLERYQNDAERLEYVKSIIQTRSNIRRSTWPTTPFLGTNEITTSAISAN